MGLNDGALSLGKVRTACQSPHKSETCMAFTTASALVIQAISKGFKLTDRTRYEAQSPSFGLFSSARWKTNSSSRSSSGAWSEPLLVAVGESLPPGSPPRGSTDPNYNDKLRTQYTVPPHPACMRSLRQENKAAPGCKISVQAHKSNCRSARVTPPVAYDWRRRGTMYLCVGGEIRS